MAENLIPKIAHLLGVELGEEFQIKNFDGLTYKFNLDGLSATPDNRTYVSAANALVALVIGKLEITKLPWKPKKDHVYYSFYVDWKDDGENYMWKVTKYFWTDSFLDFAAFKAGWVFRTREEAKAALPSVAKESGMKYEL